MIDNLFETFYLVVHNGSHKIPDGDVTYKHPRVVSKFPADANMLDLYHGNLIHSGVASKFESNSNLMHIAADLCTFLYADKYGTLKRACTRDDKLSYRENQNFKPRFESSDIGCPKMEDIN